MTESYWNVLSDELLISTVLEIGALIALLDRSSDHGCVP
jgi:hypothetical protein